MSRNIFLSSETGSIKCLLPRRAQARDVGHNGESLKRAGEAEDWQPAGWRELQEAVVAAAATRDFTPVALPLPSSLEEVWEGVHTAVAAACLPVPAASCRPPKPLCVYGWHLIKTDLWKPRSSHRFWILLLGMPEILVKGDKPRVVRAWEDSTPEGGGPTVALLGRRRADPRGGDIWEFKGFYTPSCVTILSHPLSP